MDWTKWRKVFPTARQRIRTLVSTSHTRQIISSTVVALLLASNAQARVGDWQAVENLKTGARIVVREQHRYICRVEWVTDEALACEMYRGRSLGTSHPIFQRFEIREVRVLTLPNQAKDALIGAGIGAGAGAIAAASHSNTSPGAHAFFGAIAGAGLGALVGAIVPVFQIIFQRGKLIYKA